MPDPTQAAQADEAARADRGSGAPAAPVPDRPPTEDEAAAAEAAADHLPETVPDAYEASTGADAPGEGADADRS